MCYPAFIFDFDGTLFDSWGIVCDAFRMSFQKYFPGKSVGHIDQVRYIDHAHYLDQFYFVAQSHALPKGFVEDTEKYYQEQLHLTLPMPYCQDIIGYLDSQQVPYAIVSNKRCDFLKSIMREHDFMRHCRCIITADDVKEAKPSPEGLLLAAQQLNTAPCLFVGDTMVDVEAAGLAHMDVALLCARSDMGDTVAVTYRIASLLELKSLVQTHQ